jgi:hypothetical protein
MPLILLLLRSCCALPCSDPLALESAACPRKEWSAGCGLATNGLGSCGLANLGHYRKASWGITKARLRRVLQRRGQGCRRMRPLAMDEGAQGSPMALVVAGGTGAAIDARVCGGGEVSREGALLGKNVIGGVKGPNMARGG